jgi:hypothetical protein
MLWIVQAGVEERKEGGRKRFKAQAEGIKSKCVLVLAYTNVTLWNFTLMGGGSKFIVTFTKKYFQSKHIIFLPILGVRICTIFELAAHLAQAWTVSSSGTTEIAAVT